MAEFKQGQKVRVRLDTEGGYLGESCTRGYCLIRIEEGKAIRVPASAIEVIEEPYEEGAIYQSEDGCLWLRCDDGEKPWVVVDYKDENFGERFSHERALDCGGPFVKLAPIE